MLKRMGFPIHILQAEELYEGKAMVEKPNHTKIFQVARKINDILTRRIARSVQPVCSAVAEAVGLPAPPVKAKFSLNTDRAVYNSRGVNISFTYFPSQAETVFVAAHETAHYIQDFCLNNNINAETINGINERDFSQMLPDCSVSGRQFDRFAFFVKSSPFLSESAYKILLLDDTFFVTPVRGEADWYKKFALYECNLNEIFANTIALEALSEYIELSCLSEEDLRRTQKVVDFAKNKLDTFSENIGGIEGRFSGTPIFRIEEFRYQLLNAAVDKPERLQLLMSTDMLFNQVERYDWNCFEKIFDSYNNAFLRTSVALQQQWERFRSEREEIDDYDR